MHSEESLKRRVRTAKDLHSVVRTMKVLAAVSIRQYEEAVASLTDYYRSVELGLQVVLRQTAGARTRARPPRLGGVVVFGSDQGMCGQLNEQIVTHAAEHLRGFGGERTAHRVLAVGGRIVSRLEEAGHPAEDLLPVPTAVSGITSMVQDVLLRIDEWRGSARVDQVDLLYSKRATGSASRPVTARLLPIDAAWLERLKAERWPTRRLPTFSMDRGALFSALTREYLFVSIYQAFAESLASENSSRLASMQRAERNIEERIDELTARFHEQRQMTITEELLDIAAGYEVMTQAEPGA